MLLLIGVMIGNKDEQYLRTYLSLGIYLQWPELGWEIDASQLYGAFSLSRSFLSVDIPGMEGVGEHTSFPNCQLLALCLTCVTRENECLPRPLPPSS